MTTSAIYTYRTHLLSVLISMIKKVHVCKLRVYRNKPYILYERTQVSTMTGKKIAIDKLEPVTVLNALHACV